MLSLLIHFFIIIFSLMIIKNIADIISVPLYNKLFSSGYFSDSLSIFVLRVCNDIHRLHI